MSKAMNEAEDRHLAYLLEKGQQGDQVAYSEFLTLAAQKLRLYVGRRVPSCHDPEDIVQEGLITLHRARHTYTPGRPVGPWLYAIGESRVIDAFRKRTRNSRTKMEMEHLERSRRDSGQTSQTFTEDPRLERVIELLKRLPRQQRQVIELMKIRELSVAKVSALTGMSESAVKVSAFRGYQSLRRLLGLEKK